MNKIWLKIGVAALSLLGALVAKSVEALAWGTVTHQKVVAEGRDEMEQG